MWQSASNRPDARPRPGFGPSAFMKSRYRPSCGRSSLTPSGVGFLFDSSEISAQALPENVDRNEGAVRLELPERPPVAGIDSLNMCSHSVNRSGGIRTHQRAVGTHLCSVALLGSLEDAARRQQT